MTNTSHLHPSTKALLSFFEGDHLPDHLATVSRRFGELAELVALMTWLRKPLEAKDCAVRAAVTK